MKMNKVWLFSVLSAAVCLGTGCAPKSGSPAYLLEQTPGRSLEDEAARALDHVRRAQQAHASTEDDVSDALVAAEKSLINLSGYYLPLLEARARAHNAYTFATTGQQERAAKELAGVDQVLLRIGDGELARAEMIVRQPAEKLIQAKIAISAGDVDAPRLIEELASLLNQEILKGPIELGAE